MGIGHHVQKYQAQKEAAAAAEAGAPVVEAPAPVAPAPVVATADPNMAQVLMQAMALMQQMAADKSGDKDKQDATLSLIEKLITKTHPENVDHPGLSVYSYPEGNVARPKPDLKCKMFWVGYELKTDTLTPSELELLNRLQPGEFRVTKADGTGIPFRVEAKKSDALDAQGRPAVEALSIWFPCKGDARQNHLSMTSYLQQVLGDAIPTMAEAMAELTRLKAELASARAGLVGAV